MQTRVSCKRKRGGQPGNRNAAGNRGNRYARGARGNRGGGAPRGNQNARRRRMPLEWLRRQYGQSAEAIEWLEQNAEHLVGECFADDEQRDAALYAAYRGWAPEALAEQGREFELGLFTSPDEITTKEERHENAR